MSHSCLPTSLPEGFVYFGASSYWSLLHIHGADATRFLHSQLTQDFALVRAGQARLAAYCTPKGRMLASLIAWPASTEGGDWFLLCRADVAESTIKRLRMFVLRSKVVIEDVSSQYMVIGASGYCAKYLWGDGVSTSEATTAMDCTMAWQHRTCALPDASDSPDKPVIASSSGAVRHMVTLYPAVWAGQHLPLLLCVQPRGLPLPVGAESNKELSIQDWHWMQLSSGVAHITQGSSDLFVPQMLNYESIDGVHFKKGCYPGQEVIARSQFRGAIKRRACIATACLPVDTVAQGADAGALAAQAGAEVWLCSHDAEPELAGYVADIAPFSATAAAAPASATHRTAYILIAALQVAAQNAIQQGQASLHLGTPQGAVMQLYPLPYALKNDI